MAHRSGRPPTGGRRLGERLKSARRRKASSTRWLERQLNDPYVRAARAKGYRSRSAFKLIELDERFRLLKRGMAVLDLGAAPGGWSQVAAERIGAGRPGGGRVLAADLEPIEPIPGVETLALDLLGADAPGRIAERLRGKADIVLSDVAPAATGHAATDHLRIIALCEAAFAIAKAVLAPGGSFVAKVFKGGAEGALLAEIKRAFGNVRHAKPPASRPESAETYIVATGYRGEPGP